MGKKEWETSVQSGPHAALSSLVGEWSGTARIWFEPGQPGQQSSVRGSIRGLLGGRFALHEYETTWMGESHQGLAIHGYHLDRHRYESAWVDSFHTGTQLMFSVGVPMAALHSVTGRYGDDSDGGCWGWRTEIDVRSRDQLSIRMFNVTPQGVESLAVEFDYRRVHAVRAL